MTVKIVLLIVFFAVMIGIGIYSSSDENLKLGKGENGRISVDGGDFIINSFSDAFRAEYYIWIENGNFSIKTEQGYNSLSFNKETRSAKGFFANYRVGISKGNYYKYARYFFPFRKSN